MTSLIRENVQGTILVFMPGAYEIRKTIEAIKALPESSGYDVLPLHGELSGDLQDKRLRVLLQLLTAACSPDR